MGKEKDEVKRFDMLSVRRAFGYLARLWPYLKPQWFQFIFVGIGAAMYAAGFALRIPVVKPFVDLGLDVVNLNEEDARRVLETTLPLAGMLAAGAVLMALGTFLRQYFMGYVQARTRIRLQRAVVDRLLEQPISFFNAERKGALLSRATSNISAASTLIKIAIEDLFSHPLTIIAILITMVYTSPKLTLVVLVVCPIVLVPVILFAQKIKRASRKKYQGLENQGNFFHQMLDGIRVVKAFRMQDAQKEE
ncbi:partial Lipid A export ATP-binding/permease protein MsbA, partial [Anaerolineae bacterium]